MFSTTFTNIASTSNFAKFFCLVLSFFAPFSSTIYFLILLVLMNDFSSIWFQSHFALRNVKGFRNKFRQVFLILESFKFSHTLEKFLFYTITISVLYYFDILVLHTLPLNFSGLTSFSLASIAALLISISELTTILKNISKITSIPILSKIMSILSSSNKSLFKKDNSNNSQ